MPSIARALSRPPVLRDAPLAPRRPSLVARLKASTRARRLDRAIAAGANVACSSELRLRAAKLSSAEHRAKLAEAIERAIREADAPASPLTSRAPLRREQVRGARAVLTGLALDLRDERPVHPRGVAQAELLLTDANSPLFAPEPQESLWDAAQGARQALGLAA